MSSDRRVRDRFSSIVSGKEKEDILIAIWDTAPFLNTLAGVNTTQYYNNREEKLRVQLWFQEQFPDFILLPGIWADYGAVCEPSAFGCRVLWEENLPPSALPVLTSVHDILSIKPIDPTKDGLMPKALEEYRFFWKHSEQRYIDEYGYLEGIATSFGPVELGAVLMGYQNFFIHLIESPKLMHKLFEITTNSILDWLYAQEKVNGRLKRITIADHIPGQISLKHFEEFFIPYTNQVLHAFPSAIKLYHNEFPMKDVSSIAQIEADIFHFGTDIVVTKALLGEKMTLMGNLHPIKVLLDGTPEEVIKQSRFCLEKGAPGGRFLLSSGGGLAPGTPMENIRGMKIALSEFRKLSQASALS